MKETFEWIYSWCDFCNDSDLPRVLLIGDSITNGYQDFVRKKLEGIAYVDFIAVSYPIDRPIYHAIIKQFENENNYDLIHFNNGLHGIELSKKVYKDNIKKIINEFKCKTVILANTTIVNNNHNKGVDKKWLKVINERNKVVEELADECILPIDDLFSVSKNIDITDRYDDGMHYVAAGYDILADEVVKSIKNIICDKLYD